MHCVHRHTHVADASVVQIHEKRHKWNACSKGMQMYVRVHKHGSLGALGWWCCYLVEAALDAVAAAAVGSSAPK